MVLQEDAQGRRNLIGHRVSLPRRGAVSISDHQRASRRSSSGMFTPNEVQTQSRRTAIIPSQSFYHGPPSPGSSSVGLTLKRASGARQDLITRAARICPGMGSEIDFLAMAKMLTERPMVDNAGRVTRHARRRSDRLMDLTMARLQKGSQVPAEVVAFRCKVKGPD